MTFEVRLREEADRDLTEAALWYELHGSGLWYQFPGEVLRALASIADRPFIYPVVWRDTIVVVAVMHGSRHPQNWMARR